MDPVIFHYGKFCFMGKIIIFTGLSEVLAILCRTFIKNTLTTNFIAFYTTLFNVVSTKIMLPYFKLFPFTIQSPKSCSAYCAIIKCLLVAVVCILVQ